MSVKKKRLVGVGIICLGVVVGLGVCLALFSGSESEEDAMDEEYVDEMSAEDGSALDVEGVDADADAADGDAADSDTSDATFDGVDGSDSTPIDYTGYTGTAVPSICGQLQVEGTALVDQWGNQVQLRGISTHGLQWFPEYVSEECFSDLKELFDCNVVRLAMYTAEDGYCVSGKQDELLALIDEGVAAATACDMYVIIDWHILSDGNPLTYQSQALDFFATVSAKYADCDNVIYEICNEPNGCSWSDIKSYAEAVIPVIRANDADAIILVGTPNWSQYVNEAAANPVTGYSNIMYTLHFYAATHTDWLRSILTEANAAGLPIFVSEFGICDASGSGAIDTSQANTWISLLDSLGISYVAWNLSNKNETSALLSSSCTKTSGFTYDDLSESGKWLYEVMGR